MIKVLIVEDSAVIRELLIHILSSDPEIEIVGTAADGEEAVAEVARKRPDVVTMDIHMPRVDGLEATRRIMETNPIPIVLVSGSSDPEELADDFRAVEAGALAMLPRPLGLEHEDYETTRREFVQTVKLMSEVKVVRRWARLRQEPRTHPDPAATLAAGQGVIEVIGLGASTGGPPVLRTILSALPRDYPIPLLVVQHMATGFLEGFAGWLTQACAVDVRLARQGDVVQPGHVYIAPDGKHMKVSAGGRVILTNEPPVNGLRPSVASLFQSLADVYGDRSAACLLTGMGRDGADELKLLREKGAFTIAQDRESSAVHGMPGEAIRLDAATYVLPPERIAAALLTMAGQRR